MLTRDMEMTLRTILSRDPELDPVRIDRAIDLLNGRLNREIADLEVVKSRDAMALLGVSERTLRDYVKKGILRPVYGCGNRAIGVSRKSLSAFARPRAERKGGLS